VKKIFYKIWPLLIILFAISVFFYPVWIKNQVPIPGDFLVGTYYPWLDMEFESYPAGVPVKNPIVTDVVSFIYPMRTLSVELLKQNIAPLWNSFILSGTPLLANFQSAPFSPTNIFYFFFSTFDAWSLQIISQPLLAAVFSYLLLRQIGLSKLASISGGLFFAFSGFMTIWMEWNAHSLVASMFPLLMYLVIKWLKTAKVIWGVLISISLAVQIFAGYPQIILYEFLALAILIFFYDMNLFKKRILSIPIFFILGIGLAGVQLIPGLELLNYSQRKIEDVINVSAFLPLQMIITVVAPDFFGNHVTRNWWGPGDYTLVAGYSGIVTVVLAGLGVLNNFREKYVKFGLTLIILSIIIVFENPVSSFVRNSGFLGLQAASFHRALILSNFGFAILAAFGINSLLEGKVKFHQIIRAYYLPTILISAFILGVIYSLKLAENDLIWNTNFRVALKNLILPAFLLVMSFIIFIISVKFKRLLLGSLIFLIILGVTELFRFGWKFTPFSNKEFIFPSNPIFIFLQNQEKPFRIAAEDVAPINLLMPYGLQTTEGYDAVYPLQYAKYLATLNSNNSGSTPMGRYGSIDNLDSPLLNIANTKYILSLKKDKSGIGMTTEISPRFKKDYFKKVFEEKNVVVLENTRAWDRARLFYEYEIIENGQILDRLIDPAFPVSKKIILEKNPDISLDSIGEGKLFYNEELNQKKIYVDTNRNVLLFIADTWFPGWKAYVDGMETEILRADYNFMAVPIKTGNHQVIIEYKPESFEKGKILSLASTMILLVISAVGWKTRK